MKKICLLGLVCLLAVALAVPCGAESVEPSSQAYVSSYDVYRDLVSSSEWSADFVRYEDIQELGEFAFFLYSPERDPLQNYTYVLTDEGGHEVRLTIDGPSYWPNKSNTVTDEHVYPNDMSRTADRSPRSTYTYDDITYRYIYGTLSSISWQYEGVKYEVTTDFTRYGDFMDTTAIGKLMNLDTAREMADQISEPHDRGEEITTADDTETEELKTERPTDVTTAVPPVESNRAESQWMTTAAPLDETTRSDERGPTWFDRHANAIWAIVISTSVIGVAVTFGILSRKGWRI